MFSLYVINECKRFLRPCAPSVFRRKTMHLTNWTAMENSTSISLEIVFRRVEQHILHHFVSRCLHSLSSTITRFPKKKEILTLAPSIFAIFFYNIPASELLPLKNFRKRYLLYDGTAISKLQNRKTFRGRRLFPSKVSEQSRFCRLFRENENASCKTHIHDL